jgi:hypothetical protein
MNANNISKRLLIVDCLKIPTNTSNIFYHSAIIK